jgi:hypothetical protein
MTVHQLAEALAQRAPQHAPPGTRERAEATFTMGGATRRVVGEVRVDARGRRRERWWCDGTRLQWHELLRLSCPEAECPQAQAVWAQWIRFHQRGRPTGAAQPPQAAASLPAATAALVQEVPVAIAGHHCIARPARFSCFTPCPNRAHPPLWIQKRGWDLFEQGRCVAGGLRAHDDGTARPLLPSLQAAEAYVWARHLEAQAIVSAAASPKC